MRKTISIIVVCILLIALAYAEKREKITLYDRLQGTWCTGEEGMVLRFSEKDSIFVSSASDESVQGKGKYSFTDSTFTASINNGETRLTMHYLYRWKGTDTVEAKATLFLVNDEAIEHPQEWMSMVRCGEKTRKNK